MNAPSRLPNPVLAVLAGGGIAATIDIVYACISNFGRYGLSPEWVCQSVASGWLGMAAFDGGMGAAALGLASHYFILFVAAFLYLKAGARWPMLRAQAITYGAIYGVGIYLFMNFVVLKVTAFPFHPVYPFMKLVEGFASHALFVGVPIGLAARRWG